MQILQTKYPSEELTILAQTLVGIKTNIAVKQSSVAKNFTKRSSEKVLPNNFSLAQNYPNPFNPQTAIRFSIPLTPFPRGNSVVVSLKIYDVLGRDVATLIDNAVLQAGSYEKSWNAEELQSGVYFYRLTAGTFSETKKLLLMK